MKYDILPPAADKTVFIPGEAVVKAGFKDAPVLSVLAEENAIIVLKEEMTAQELVETVNSLQDISAGMLLKAMRESGIIDKGFCYDDDNFPCEFDDECDAADTPPCMLKNHKRNKTYRDADQAENGNDDSVIRLRIEIIPADDSESS